MEMNIEKSNTLWKVFSWKPVKLKQVNVLSEHQLKNKQKNLKANTVHFDD